ncbi:MAG: hypothetical protein ACD_15C00206G0001, partial [uncultured bacterium]
MHILQKQNSKTNLKIWVIMAIIAVFSFFQTSWANINKEINYQAKLTNNQGVSVANGNYDMVFKLYTVSSGGTAIWTGNYTAANGNPVAVSNGVFSVLLGSGTGNSLGSIDFSSDTYYLGVTVGTDSEMTPRKRLGAAPQAINSNSLIGDGLIRISGTPSGSGVGQGTVYINPTSATNDYTLFGVALNGAQRFRIDEDGDVTAVGQITSTLATGTSPFNVTSTTVNTNLNADLLDGLHSSAFLQNANLSGRSSADANVADDAGVTAYYLAPGATNKPAGTDHSLLTLSYSNLWSTQMAGDWRTNNWYVREQNDGTWGDWDLIYTSGNDPYDTETEVDAAVANNGYLTANQSITLSGDVSGSGTTAITVANNLLSRDDNRAINPAELAAGKFRYGFTSWANNNTAPYADYMHMRGYTDATGGNDNLLMFSKSGIAMRIWQQTWGSATDYANYRDAVMTDQNSANVTLSGSLTPGGNLILGANTLTTSNTGLISNLNTDLLDGYHGASASTINTYALRDASGDINARLFKSEYDTTNASIGYIMTQIDTASNNYLRPSTPAQLKTALGLDAGGAGDIWVEKAGDTMTGSLTFSGATNDIVTGTNEHFSIMPNGTGNVGIGTTGPGYKLTIAGTSHATTPQVFVGSNLGFGSYDSNYAWIQSFASLPLYINAQGNNTIINPTSGNVGIGTPSPSTKLNIIGGTNGFNTGIFRIENNAGTSANTGASIEFYSNENTPAQVEMGRIGTLLTNGVAGAASSDLAFSTRNAGSLTEWMRIKASGNVGIGTATPNNKLHIYDGTNITPSSTAVGQLGILGSGYSGYTALDGTAMYIGHNSSLRNLTFQTDETDRLTIAGNGNVGIGTNSPTASHRLTVMASDARFDVTSSITTNASLRIISNNTNYASLDVGLASDAYVTTKNLVLQPNGGNVGIGDTTPDHKLDVAGSIGLNASSYINFGDTDGST